ncbi:molybdopterin-dependent oxidoreductase [Sphingomonas sp. YL-JM2C]
MPDPPRTGIQTASHWGVYSVQPDGGAVTPFAADPAPSGLIHGLPAIVRDELRIDRPYVRAGFLTETPADPHRRGSDSFVPMSWDDALDLVARELGRVKTTFGNRAIYGGSYGWASAGRLHHAPSLLKRFLGQFGGFVDKIGNHSYGAAFGIMPHVIGRQDINKLVTPWSSIVDHGELVVMFGGAHAKNSQVGGGGAVLHEYRAGMERAAAAGIRFVNISPARADLDPLLDPEWISIRPHGDVAAMLGIAHSLLEEGLCDLGFLHSHCEGFPIFRDYVLGRSDGVAKDPCWAAERSGIAADAILSLARRMARSRTLVTVSWSVQRARHGEQPIWMAVALAAMLGQIGRLGCGFSIGFGAVNGSTASVPDDIPRPTFPIGRNPVADAVPVALVGEMLLDPGGRFEHDGGTFTYPDIRLLYSAGGNPFHHNGDLNRFMAGWRRPETIIVHEHWWGPAARFADIVLPAATTMERNDILAADGQRHFLAMRRVIDPVGEARSDFDIFTALAARLGFVDAYAEGRDEMQWLRHMYDVARPLAIQRGHAMPCFDDFWQDGQVEFSAWREPEALLAAFRADPVGHKLATPSGKIELYSATIASFGYDDCPPHPSWIDHPEWLGGSLAHRFPLHLLSNQPATRLHSQLDPAPLSRASKIDGREPIRIHGDDARRRNISTGDVVRVFNDRGAFAAAAVIDDDLHPGTVQIATGAWYDPINPGELGSLERHGNPNVVTPATGSSRLSQGSAAQTSLVEIELFTDAPRPAPFSGPPFSSP